MKTSFKRALSVVLALCVLLASATCLMGMTVSAEDEKVKAFGVEIWSTATKQILFYDTASGKELHNAYMGIKTGDKVSVTFDYFTDSTGIGVRPYADMQGDAAGAQVYSGAAQWANCDASYLDVGTGKFELTYTATADRDDRSIVPFFNINGAGAVVGKVLYFWNVEITIDHVDGEDATITTDDLQIYKSDSTATKISPTTYDINDMKTVWSWTPTGNYLKFVRSGYKSYQTASDDLQDPITGVQGEVGDTFQISFDYYVTGDAEAGDFVVESTSGWGSDEFSEKIYINKGRGTASKTFTINKKGASYGIQPLIKYYGEGEATLNIWNVKFTKDGVATQVHLYSNDNKYPSVTSVNALNIPEVDEEDELALTKVFKLEGIAHDGSGTATEKTRIYIGGLHDGVFKTLGHQAGDTVSLSFDYYNPNGGSWNATCTSGAVADGYNAQREDVWLSTGFGHYDSGWTTTEKAAGDYGNNSILPKFEANGSNVGKDAYVWNIVLEIHSNGKDYRYTTEDIPYLYFKNNTSKKSYPISLSEIPVVKEWDPDEKADSSEMSFNSAYYKAGAWNLTFKTLSEAVTAVKGNATVGKTVNISFDYAIDGFRAGAYKVTSAEGSATFDKAISLDTKKGTVNETLTVATAGTFNPVIKYTGYNIDSKLYIWNLKLSYDGKTFGVSPTGGTFTDRTIPYVDGLELEEVPVVAPKTKTFAISGWANTGESSGKADTIRFGGKAAFGQTASSRGLVDFCYNTSPVTIKIGETVRIKFNYYNPDNAAYYVSNSTKANTNIGEQTGVRIGKGYGSIDVSYEVTKEIGNASFAPELVFDADNTGKTTYFWGFEVWVTRYEEATEEFVDYYFTSENGEIEYLYKGSNTYDTKTNCWYPAAYEECFGIKDDNTTGVKINVNNYYLMSNTLSSFPKTIEAKIKVPKTLADTTRGGVITGNYANGRKGVVNFEIHQNGNPRVYIIANDNTIKDVKFNKVDVRTGRWMNLAVTYDATAKTITCYVNGEARQTVAGVDFTIFAPSTTLCVGGDSRGGGDSTAGFKGEINQVCYFSDTRSAQEMEADVDGIDLTDENLMAAYDLSNGYQKNVDDSSANGNDLICQGVYFLDEKDVPELEDYAYSFAVVGDTQMINWHYPEQFSKIYDWILDNAENYNIQHVFGLGDITDQDTTREWNTAITEFEKLDGKLSYTLVRGNHDSKEKFDLYLGGESAYAAQYDGAFVAGSSLNTYKYLTIGTTDYLVFNLDFGFHDDVIDWASEIIENHPNHNVIITTHAYLYRDGSTIDENENWPPSYYDQENNNGDDMWDEFISKHENIVLVLSGHDPSAKVVTTQTKGENGNVVTQMLIDPQSLDVDASFGPTGMVTMLYFSEDGKTVQVRNYSTIKEQYFNKASQYTITIDKVDAVMGDANDDRVVDILDLVIVSRAVKEEEVSYNKNTADANGDKVINDLDLAEIRRIILG